MSGNNTSGFTAPSQPQPQPSPYPLSSMEEFVEFFRDFQLSQNDIMPAIFDYVRTNYDPDLPQLEDVSHLLAQAYYKNLIKSSWKSKHKNVRDILSRAPYRINLGPYDPICITDLVALWCRKDGYHNFPDFISPHDLAQLRYPVGTIPFNYSILRRESESYARVLYQIDAKYRESGCQTTYQNKIREKDCIRKKVKRAEKKIEEQKKILHILEEGIERRQSQSQDTDNNNNNNADSNDQPLIDNDDYFDTEDSSSHIDDDLLPFIDNESLFSIDDDLPPIAEGDSPLLPFELPNNDEYM